MANIAKSKLAALALACLAIGTLPAGCSDKASMTFSRHKATVDPVRNDLVITGDGRILWNRVIVTQDELSTLLQATANRKPEPELRFRPEANASYDLSAAVIERIKASTDTKFGFVGNELYSASESSGN